MAQKGADRHAGDMKPHQFYSAFIRRSPLRIIFSLISTDAFDQE